MRKTPPAARPLLVLITVAAVLAATAAGQTAAHLGAPLLCTLVLGVAAYIGAVLGLARACRLALDRTLTASALMLLTAAMTVLQLLRTALDGLLRAADELRDAGLHALTETPA